MEPRDGSVVQWIQNEGKNTSERACRALLDGEVDALGITESQLAIMLGNQSVKRLFENSRDVEAEYFRQTKILPIMHVLALRRELADKHPELPEQLFRLFTESKRWAQRWRRVIPSLVEAWPNHYLDEERKIFEGDPWVYGVEANRHVRPLAAEELFHSTTLKLAE